jgi:hypothetical protein
VNTTLSFCCNRKLVPYIMGVENLCTSKWYCLDSIWSSVKCIYPILGHFDFTWTQKFETEFVIWKRSQIWNQVQMTQYWIFYCIIDQNLSSSPLIHHLDSQLIFQSNHLLPGSQHKRFQVPLYVWLLWSTHSYFQGTSCQQLSKGLIYMHFLCKNLVLDLREASTRFFT